MFPNDLKLALIRKAYKSGGKTALIIIVLSLSYRYDKKSPNSVYIKNSWTILRTTNYNQIESLDCTRTVPLNRLLNALPWSFNNKIYPNSITLAGYILDLIKTHNISPKLPQSILKHAKTVLKHCKSVPIVFNGKARHLNTK